MISRISAVLVVLLAVVACGGGGSSTPVPAASGGQVTNPPVVGGETIDGTGIKAAVDALKKYLEVNPQAGDAQQIKGYIKQLEPLVGAASPGQ